MLRLEHTGGLELDSTLDCGQCFRWSRTPAGWAGVVDGRSVLARMEGDTLLLEGPDETERDFWSRYFALDVDYPALLARYQAGNRRLAACVAENPGIRVLRQPFFETLCTFILSQNNNIPRIRGLVERLCALCGSPLENGQHAFPTPEQLAACTEEQLATLRAGWRAGYLADAAQKVLGPLPGPEALTALPLADAQAALMTIHGVGPKVADCTLLYGLGRWDAFPLDVWMKRAMAQLFPRGIPVCCRGTQGIAQQFIFAYARAHLPKGETPKQAGPPAGRNEQQSHIQCTPPHGRKRRRLFF